MNKESWDKMILLLAGMIAIGVTVIFALEVKHFPENFTLQKIAPKDDLPATQEDMTKVATSFVEKTQTWSNPKKGEPAKSLPLFVSVPIVEAGGRLIDMSLEDPLLRPPVSNAWLRENGLDFLNSGVLAQDTDSDGFDNLTEWNAKTSPIDPKSHPPYAGKLIFASRQQESYTLRFAAKPDADRFQINRLPTTKWPKGENFYLKIAETSKDAQFRLDGYEEKSAKNASGIEVDASVLKITYLPKNEVVELVRNANTVIPTYFAEMQFELDPSFKQYVKEGDTFNLVIDPDTKYRVVKVEENSVEVSYQTGTESEKTIQISKK